MKCRASPFMWDAPLPSALAMRLPDTSSGREPRDHGAPPPRPSAGRRVEIQSNTRPRLSCFGVAALGAHLAHVVVHVSASPPHPGRSVFRRPVGDQQSLACSSNSPPVRTEAQVHAHLHPSPTRFAGNYPKVRFHLQLGTESHNDVVLQAITVPRATSPEGGRYLHSARDSNPCRARH